MMNGILRSIEEEKLDKPLKKVTWKLMTDEQNSSTKQQQNTQIDWSHKLDV